MALCKSKMVLCTVVYVLGMFLFAEARYQRERELIVANAGDNVTLRCNTLTRYTTYIYWVKDNHDYIAAVSEDTPQGWFYDKSHFTQSYEMEISYGLFKLYIYDAVPESAIYECRYGNIQEYDVRVIGCSTCFLKSSASHGFEQPKMNVNCHLNNFQTADQMRQHIIINKNRPSTAIIEGSILTFNISITMMYGSIQVEFNPFNDTLSNITCIIPAQLTTPQSYTSPSTLLITTSATSLSKALAKSLATKSGTKSETTSAAITTAQLITPQSFTAVKLSPSSSPSTTISAKSSSKISTAKSETAGITTTGTKSYDSTPKSSLSPIMETSYLTSGTTTSYQTRQNINPGTGNNIKNKRMTTIVIASFVSILFIFVIVIIILVLRLRQSRDRQHGKRNKGEINVTVREQDTCYESIGGSSGIRDGELINNVLYESSDDIIQSSIWRSGDDQLDTDLYTIPDKTGIINRVAKPKIVSVSHQPEQKEFKQVDQYKNIDMPNLGAGDDDDTNIPLYAMPDKGPRSTRNTMNTSPGSASTEGGVDIPLYALPDKRPGSKGNMMKATPRPEKRNEGDEIPLYAVLNKETGSKDNRPKVKPKPGGHSSTVNKDDALDEEALYAEVDKPN